MLAFPSPLYAILDVDFSQSRGHAPLDVLDCWLDAGVRLVQLRAKQLESGAMLSLADAMAARCRAAGALFIVNDRADIAALSGAAGVHVGQDDLSPADARKVVGSERIVGCSTHTEAQVEAALTAPISYLAVGPVFSTASKAAPDPVIGLAGVVMAVERARARRVPVVAIGGITLDRTAAVLDAGADAVAVISDLLAGDIGTRARAFLRVVCDRRPT